jgi:predicted acylesterase/phospholipase RssA
MFINIGYNMNEINDILFKINFKEFQECKIINFINTFGFDEGIKFTNFLKATILHKNFDPNITFQELYEKTEKFLTIAVLNITKGITEYHNYKTTPNLCVLTSVRMSSNIPILFSPIIYDNNYYVDGALLDPFPYNYNKDTNKIGFWLFDQYEINFIKNSNSVYFVNNSTDSFNYIFNLLKIMHVNYIKEYYKKIINNKLKNVILIDFDYKNVSFENFYVKLEDKINMFNIGMKKAKFFIKKHNKIIRKKYLANKYYYIWKNKTF